MTIIFRDLIQKVRRRLGPATIGFEGSVLPPAHMRYCGNEFRDDATFLGSGRDETRRLIDDFGLDGQTRLLEVGCGPGRLPIGMLAEFGGIARYDGVDIDAAAVKWCRRHITRHYPQFRFHVIDAQHDRYNPTGRGMDSSFALPFEENSFDLIYLHSIFSNMLENDVRVYSREFCRLIQPDGSVFLTAFLEEDVPPITVNPDDYHIPNKGPLNVARYEQGHFLQIMRDSGFEISQFSYASELGGQSAIHLRPTRDRV